VADCTPGRRAAECLDADAGKSSASAGRSASVLGVPGPFGEAHFSTKRENCGSSAFGDVQFVLGNHFDADAATGSWRNSRILPAFARREHEPTDHRRRSAGPPAPRSARRSRLFSKAHQCIHLGRVLNGAPFRRPLQLHEAGRSRSSPRSCPYRNSSLRHSRDRAAATAVDDAYRHPRPRILATGFRR